MGAEVDAVALLVLLLAQINGAHRTGSEGAALVVLSYALAAYLLYAALPSFLSGALLGELELTSPGTAACSIAAPVAGA